MAYKACLNLKRNFEKSYPQLLPTAAVHVIPNEISWDRDPERLTGSNCYTMLKMSSIRMKMTESAELYMFSE